MIARHWALALMVAGATLTVCDFGAFRDVEMMRTVPKYLGQVSLLAGIAAYLAMTRLQLRSAPSTSDWLWALLFAAPLGSIMFGELANQPQQALMPLMRWISALGLVLVVLRLEASETQRALNWFRWSALMISLIGIIFFIFQFDTREKFPVIELFSTKSIIFEQNIFGIIAYFGICSWWLAPPAGAGRAIKWTELLIFTAAGFLSYYKTTIVLGLLITLYLGFGAYALAAGGLLCASVGLYFFDELMLLSQIDTNGVSSGRFELWTIGMHAWQQHLIFGIGESGITPTIAKVIVRDPPFTTFHSVFVDTVAAGGAIGLLSLLLTILLAAWRLKSRFLRYAMLLAPAAFNTFYIGSPNILGLTSILFFHSLCHDMKSSHRRCDGLQNP